jgi:hypothetical protein
MDDEARTFMTGFASISSLQVLSITFPRVHFREIIGKKELAAVISDTDFVLISTCVVAKLCIPRL